ncbi:MAG: surface-adhesin E family protein [Novosphingobium sp.]|uniref:surface-adhesin E family protein n=1 Tax=Novosphingobium sp. TaxID=1874826 RepID=UPI003C7A1511
MRIVKPGLIAALMAAQLGLAQPAFAGDDRWVKVSSSDDGTSEHWVDSKSINRKGDVVSYIERAKINDDETGWDTVVASSQINCETSQVHPVQLKITFTSGKTETVDNPDPEDWNDIPAGSVGSDIRDFVCKS